MAEDPVPTLKPEKGSPPALTTNEGERSKEKFSVLYGLSNTAEQESCCWEQEGVCPPDASGAEKERVDPERV